MSLDDVFKAPKRADESKRTVLHPAVFMLMVAIVPAYFAGLAWLVTVSVTTLIADGVSFWPILGLVIAAHLILWRKK